MAINPLTAVYFKEHYNLIIRANEAKYGIYPPSLVSHSVLRSSLQEKHRIIRITQKEASISTGIKRPATDP